MNSFRPCVISQTKTAQKIQTETLVSRSHRTYNNGSKI